jgi:chaperonin cofactor prefoldin
MKAKLIFLLIGIALGTLISAAAWVVRRPARVAFVEELAADRRQLRTELATLQTRIARLETDNARLTADNLTLKTPPAPKAVTNAKPATPVSPLAALFGGGKDGTNKTGEVFANMMKAGIQHQIEGKMSALKLRLKLTEAQEKAIRERLQAQFDRAGEMASRMFQGKLSKEEMEKMGGMETDAETGIRQLLSAEQAAEYDKLRQEERQVQAARVANMELLQMQSALQLTTEQQDQVYNILYDQTLKMVSGNNQMPLTAWPEQMKARTEALRGVLTAEQFQAYEKQQEAQRQMVNGLMQSFGMGSNSADGATIQIEVAP